VVMNRNRMLRATRLAITVEYLVDVLRADDEFRPKASPEIEPRYPRAAGWQQAELVDHKPDVAIAFLAAERFL